MKRFIALLLVLVLVLSVVACGKKEEPAKEEPAKEEPAKEEPAGEEPAGEEPAKEEPAAGGKKVLKLLETSNIPSMISWRATDTVSFLILGNVNSGLVNYDKDAVTVVGDMAEKWEVSEDGLEYTFHLRDADWVTVDGEVYGKVTANDFIYAWKKLIDPKEASQYSFLIATGAFKNGKEAVELSEKIVNYNNAEEDLKGLKVESFNEIEARSAQQQYDEAKEVLEKSLADAQTDEEKEELAKKIEELSVDNFEDIEAVSPEAQYEKAKADAEQAFEELTAAINEEYGSIEAANEKVQELIDGLGVEAVDDKTLKITLSNPVPFFVDLLAFPSMFPVNQKFVEEQGNNYASGVDKLLYNGAYVFKEWTLSEKHLLVKNEAYWDAANVDVDEVDYRVIEGVNNNTAVQMYLDSEIDSVGLSGENVEKFGNRPDAVQREDTVIFYLELNQGNGVPTANKQFLANPKARKAINMGFDKAFITEKIFANGSLAADYFIPRGFTANDEGVDFRKVAGEAHNGEQGYNAYNPEEAGKLWEEAKNETGMQKIELELLIFQGELNAKVGAHIKNELEKNLPGLTLNIEALPFSEKIQRASQGNFEMNFGGWGPDYPDAMTFMDMWVTGGGHNTTGYSNAEYDAIIAEAKGGDLTAPDKTIDRFKELVRAEKILLEDDQVIVPMYQRATIGLRNPEVKDLVFQKTGPDYVIKYIKLEKAE